MSGASVERAAARGRTCSRRLMASFDGVHRRTLVTGDQDAAEQWRRCFCQNDLRAPYKQARHFVRGPRRDPRTRRSAARRADHTGDLEPVPWADATGGRETSALRAWTRTQIFVELAFANWLSHALGPKRAASAWLRRDTCSTNK